MGKTQTQGQGGANKERKKILLKNYEKLKIEKINLEKLPINKKLELEINDIKNTIKNCKYDLKGQFKNNNNILIKLKIAEEELNRKQNELIKLNGEINNGNNL